MRKRGELAHGRHVTQPVDRPGIDDERRDRDHLHDERRQREVRLYAAQIEIAAGQQEEREADRDRLMQERYARCRQCRLLAEHPGSSLLVGIQHEQTGGNNDDEMDSCHTIARASRCGT